MRDLKDSSRCFSAYTSPQTGLPTGEPNQLLLQIQNWNSIETDQVFQKLIRNQSYNNLDQD